MGRAKGRNVAGLCSLGRQSLCLVAVVVFLGCVRERKGDERRKELFGDGETEFSVFFVFSFFDKLLRMKLMRA